MAARRVDWRGNIRGQLQNYYNNLEVGCRRLLVGMNREDRYKEKVKQPERYPRCWR